MTLNAAVESGQPGYPGWYSCTAFPETATSGVRLAKRFRRPRLYLDLPGHGGSADIAVDGFTGVSELLQATLNSYNILDYWLVGYSWAAGWR